MPPKILTAILILQAALFYGLSRGESAVPARPLAEFPAGFGLWRMRSDNAMDEEVKATLLSDNNGQVWKIGNDIVTGGYAESYRFPEVPANLYDHPTLLMSLENSGAQKQQIEISRQMNGLTEKRVVSPNYPVRPGDTIKVAERWF